MNACILVTGAQGQVGHALMGQAPEHLQVTGLGSAELDIRDPLAVEQCIARLQPRLIINAAAMLLFRKQIPAKYENYIHFAGLILLLALMVVLVFSDVGKLIH